MVIGSVWRKFVMGLFQEYIGEVLTPFWESGFLDWCFLGNVSRNGDFSYGFSGKPLFSLSKSLSGF